MGRPGDAGRAGPAAARKPVPPTTPDRLPADPAALAAGRSADQSQAPVQDQHRFGCRRRDSPGAHLCRHRVPQHGRLAGPRIQPAFGHPQCVEHLDHLPVPRLRVDRGRRGWLVCGRNPISQRPSARSTRRPGDQRPSDPLLPARASDPFRTVRDLGRVFPVVQVNPENWKAVYPRGSQVSVAAGREPRLATSRPGPCRGGQSFHRCRSRPGFLSVPFPEAAAAGPGDGRVQSGPSSRVHEPCSSTEAVALRSRTGLTGSGSHTYSSGGFGRGRTRFHPHTGCREPDPGLAAR